MKDFIKNKLNEYFDDFGDVDFTQLNSKEPKLKKPNTLNLLVKDTNVSKTMGKINSYTFSFGPSKIVFKPTAKDNVIELDLITTPENFRGQGMAKKVMDNFLNLIDRYKLKVVLSVIPRDKTTSVEGLEKFYSDFGFNKISDFEMIR